MLDGTPESPRPLSQDEKNTAVTSEMQNSSVYPKSIHVEPHFPLNGSIDILRYTSYRPSGLTYFRKLQRFPETQVSSLYEYKFQYSNSSKVPCTPYHPKMRALSVSLIEDVSQTSTSISKEFFLSNMDVTGTLCFLSQVEWTPRGHE